MAYMVQTTGSPVPFQIVAQGNSTMKTTNFIHEMAIDELKQALHEIAIAELKQALKYLSDSHHGKAGSSPDSIERKIGDEIWKIQKQLK